MVNLVVLYAIYPGSNPGLPTNFCGVLYWKQRGNDDNIVSMFKGKRLVRHQKRGFKSLGLHYIGTLLLVKALVRGYK